MSKCFLCGQRSFIFIKFGNKRKEKHYFYLCQKCFERLNNISTIEKRRNEKCPVCGYTISEFNEYKFLGCDSCYENFYPEILNYLKKIHINVFYKGKFPKRFKFYEKKIKKILELKNHRIESIKKAWKF
ncbi:MAG: hypothetical protein ACP5OB_02710 [Candidatus Ratteibacteria bacterium]